mmetsp:Transcript_3141/g.4581  ORF Transcript_3141/g.4581 Transcript_3141/m.4581 type:complete len:139 (-) Transcript_3141:378-794(-)
MLRIPHEGVEHNQKSRQINNNHKRPKTIRHHNPSSNDVQYPRPQLNRDVLPNILPPNHKRRLILHHNLMTLPEKIHDRGIYYHCRVHECDDDARPDEDHGVVGEEVGEIECDALGHFFGRVFVKFFGWWCEGVGGEAE